MYFGRNDNRMNVKNGTLGTVERMGVHRMTVRLDGEGTQRLVQVDLGAYQHIDHGYAATVHKSQGATLDRSYVLASKLYDSSKSYVSMSRHRDGVEMHWARDEFGSSGELLRVLTREVTKELALEQLAAERSFTLEEVLRDDSVFELLSPVEQRRMIREAESAPAEPTRPIEQEREALLRAQPEVQAANQQLAKAGAALTQAREALETYRELPIFDKRVGGERELEQRASAARASEQAVAREVREAMQNAQVVARAEQQLMQQRQQRGQRQERVQRWRGHVAEVQRTGAREHALELGRGAPQRSGLPFGAGPALKALLGLGNEGREPDRGGGWER